MKMKMKTVPSCRSPRHAYWLMLGAFLFFSNLLLAESAPPDGIGFSSASLNFEGDEDSLGDITLTVEIPAPEALDVSVEFYTLGVTAVPVFDFLNVPQSMAGSVTIPAGETSATFTVTVFSDNIVEADESMQVLLQNAAGTALSTQNTADISIVNDDSVSININSISTNEAFEEANLVVSITGFSALDVTYSYHTVAGSATAGDDFTAVASGTGIIAAGTSSAFISIDVNNDALYEGTESFQVELTSAAGADLGSSIGNITLADNETAPTLTIADQEFNESTGSAAVQLTLSGAMAADLDVNVQTSAGTAAAGSDYTSINQVVTITAGNTSGSVPLELLNDSDIEGDETLQIGFTSGDPFVLEVNDPATLTITDDDQDPCTLNPSDFDGDGICDDQEMLDGSDPTDPCDPVADDYDGDGFCDNQEMQDGSDWNNNGITDQFDPFDPLGDDDGDGILNGAEDFDGDDHPYDDDMDGDSLPNNADDDSDGDGILDADEWGNDWDGNGINDMVDP